ncbi:GNAT family N-acetyltransferase [Mesorhizobium sp. ES1-1]|nr:GNAT family N-acetyltransferase [Mesorhizobium sp. ES1-1]MBZ9676197.1 GNAT family N-acetyltransferase [Mesorhizobium sp. ES1-1]
MPQSDPMIRTLSLAEIETLIDWAADQGWNPGLHDAAAFQAADPDGFIGAVVDGQMVAGISAVAYDADFGFIGLYICRPDMRGKGIGKSVWDAGMALLGGRTIGLDGVPAQQANYRRMGFAPAYRTVRFSGEVAPKPAGAWPTSLKTITPDLLPWIEAFDRTCFPATRPAFLERWTAPPHIALVDMDGTSVRGYGVARQCREGFKIGPLSAIDLDTAKAIFSALANRCSGPAHIDVPEAQAGLASELTERGMSPGFETARMYFGPPPTIAAERVFAVGTLELG